MTIIKCGTVAKTKLNNIEGIITGVSIRFSRVSYEFTYFNNGDERIIWIDECQINITKEDKKIIGFK